MGDYANINIKVLKSDKKKVLLDAFAGHYPEVIEETKTVVDILVEEIINGHALLENLAQSDIIFSAYIDACGESLPKSIVSYGGEYIKVITDEDENPFVRIEYKDGQITILEKDRKYAEKYWEIRKKVEKAGISFE